MVHKPSQTLCQSTFLLQLCICTCCNTWIASLESFAGSLPEHTPAAYVGAFHAYLWPSTQTPHCNQFTQQGCQLTGLELRIPKIELKFRGSGPEIFWRPPQNFQNRPKKPNDPRVPAQNRLIFVSMDSSRRQDTEYIIYIGIDTCRQKVMRTPGEIPPPEWLQKFANLGLTSCKPILGGNRSPLSLPLSPHE